jgi:hypothetical protein
VTTPVWFFLILGALVNIGFVLLFIDRRSESVSVMMLMMAAVTIMIVSGLLLVRFLDHPYEDSGGGIKPDVMQRALDTMADERPALAVPCDRRGDPLQPG